MKFVDWLIAGIIVALVGLVAILGMSLADARRKIRSSDNAIELLTDSITRFKASDGVVVSKTDVAMAKPKDVVRSAQILNNKPLEQAAKQKGVQSATVLNYKYTIDTTYKRNSPLDDITWRSGDTTQATGKAFVFRDSIVNDYLELHEVVSLDSIHRKILLKDTVSVSFVLEKQGFLKKKKLVVQVRNENPYASQQDIKSFTVPEKKRSAGSLLLTAVLIAAGLFLFAK